MSFTAIITGAVGFIKSWQKNKAQANQQKTAYKNTLAILKQKELIALANAKIKQAEQGRADDLSLNMQALKNMRTTLKDEYLLLIITIPFVMAFIPELANHALQGFKVIDQMPEWIQYLFMGIVIVTFGMRGLMPWVPSRKGSN